MKPIGFSQPSAASAVITGAAPLQTERPSGVAEPQGSPAAQASEAPKIPAEPLAATTLKSPLDTSAGMYTNTMMLSEYLSMRRYCSVTNQYNHLQILFMPLICSPFPSCTSHVFCIRDYGIPAGAPVEQISNPSVIKSCCCPLGGTITRWSYIISCQS